jgi:NTP pyrophosphatase (non-canonical NTP hydrolase)
MSDIDRLIETIVKYRNARDWKQFHNPKDSSIALSLEASEVMQHFLWQNKEEMDEYVKNHKSEIADELSDVLYWTLLMSYDLNIDILKAFDRKMKENKKKYPVKKAKGKHLKYTEYK